MIFLTPPGGTRAGGLEKNLTGRYNLTGQRPTPSLPPSWDLKNEGKRSKNAQKRAKKRLFLGYFKRKNSTGRKSPFSAGYGGYLFFKRERFSFSRPAEQVTGTPGKMGLPPGTNRES